MKEAWTGKVIGQMHTNEITYDDLAAELGWNKSYVSMILNGSRKPANGRERIELALKSITERRKNVTKSGCVAGVQASNDK